MCRARPFLMMILLVLVPHLAGSIFNVSYNELLIVKKAPLQQSCFHWLVMVYNTAAYPLILIVVVIVISRARQGWRRCVTTPMSQRTKPPRVAGGYWRMPGWTVVLSCLGWLRGASSSRQPGLLGRAARRWMRASFPFVRPLRLDRLDLRLLRRAVRGLAQCSIRKCGPIHRRHAPSRSKNCEVSRRGCGVINRWPF